MTAPTRSCGRAAARSPLGLDASRKGFALPRSGAFNLKRYCVTRSIRSSARPQLRARSVAFDDHGDTVPRARRYHARKVRRPRLAPVCVIGPGQRRAGIEQRRKSLALRIRERRIGPQQVHMARRDRRHRRRHRPGLLEQSARTKIAQRNAAGKDGKAGVRIGKTRGGRR